MQRFERCPGQTLESQVDMFRDLLIFLRASEGADIDSARLLIPTDFLSYPAAARRLAEQAMKDDFVRTWKGGLHDYIVDASSKADLYRRSDVSSCRMGPRSGDVTAPAST